MIIFKYISSTINSLSQLIVKHLGLGRADVQESTQISPFGLDSRPVKDTIGVRSDTSERGASIVLGYVLTDRVAKEGEFRTYATDSNGNEVAYTYMTNAGDLELNGKDDNAVRFSELKSGFDTLKSDLNSLITAYNSHIHVTTATIGPGPAVGVIAPTTSTGTSSAASVDASKIDKVKVPKEG
jgi:hypothetical protein